jgi:hypothetical protein
MTTALLYVEISLIQIEIAQLNNRLNRINKIALDQFGYINPVIVGDMVKDLLLLIDKVIYLKNLFLPKTVKHLLN